jgi:hypothetical protein
MPWSPLRHSPYKQEVGGSIPSPPMVHAESDQFDGVNRAEWGRRPRLGRVSGRTVTYCLPSLPFSKPLRRGHKSQYRVKEMAATQSISTSTNTKSQEGTASLSRGCTLIMLSVKFLSPLDFEEDG